MTSSTPGRRTARLVKALFVGSVAQILLLVAAVAVNLITENWRNPVPYMVAVAAAIAAAFTMLIRGESRASTFDAGHPPTPTATASPRPHAAASTPPAAVGIRRSAGVWAVKKYLRGVVGVGAAVLVLVLGYALLGQTHVVDLPSEIKGWGSSRTGWGTIWWIVLLSVVVAILGLVCGWTEGVSESLRWRFVDAPSKRVEVKRIDRIVNIVLVVTGIVWAAACAWTFSANAILVISVDFLSFMFGVAVGVNLPPRLYYPRWWFGILSR
jgi:hypothetical protein